MLVAIEWRPSTKQLRGFGLIAALFGAGLGAWVFLKHSLLGLALGPSAGPIAACVFWGVGAVCLALAIAAPRGLWPLYVLLNAVTLPIGIAVSFVILLVLFYLVFTPVSLVFRLIGRDALQRRFDRSAVSYWVPRESRPDMRRYFRQF